MRIFHRHAGKGAAEGWIVTGPPLAQAPRSGPSLRIAARFRAAAVLLAGHGLLETLGQPHLDDGLARHAQPTGFLVE